MFPLPALVPAGRPDEREPTRCSPVVAVLRDGPADVTVARHAARRARREGRPLVLVIPLPRAPVADQREAAAAISGRVQPELQGMGATASVCTTTYADSGNGRRRERRALAAVDRAATRLGASVVLSAALSLTGLTPAPDRRVAPGVPAPEPVPV